jgi:hypothetical protein
MTANRSRSLQRWEVLSCKRLDDTPDGRTAWGQTGLVTVHDYPAALRHAVGLPFDGDHALVKITVFSYIDDWAPHDVATRVGDCWVDMAYERQGLMVSRPYPGRLQLTTGDGSGDRS